MIHSPYPDERLLLPWALPADLPHAAAGQTPFYMATAYLAVALLLFVWSRLRRQLSLNRKRPR